MRDRRNTSLSVSPTESAAGSPSTKSSRDILNEKDHASLPPLSPSLPAPVTKENRPRSHSRRPAATKALAALCVLLLLWQYSLGSWQFSFKHFVSDSKQNSETELAGDVDLPDEPTALMITTPNGRSRWTVSIPRNHSFPLSGQQYNDICTNGVGFRNIIRDNVAHKMRRKHWMRTDRQPKEDRTYLDIREAEATGILSSSGQKEELLNVCDSSMTFVLESDEASFGKSLLLLWLSYGLAKKEGRAFFVDDTRWAWGKFASYFAPPPLPKCTRPPSHHIVPCPRNARHLVVSSATASWTFGPAFRHEFRTRRKHGLVTQSRIYKLLRNGYEDLFRLTQDDAQYAAERSAKLRNDAVNRSTTVIGMQIRRGDQHPFEFQYNQDYLPLERYAVATKSLLEKTIGKKASVHHNVSLLVASDDPEIFNSDDLHQAIAPFNLQRAQDRILLATKALLDEATPVQQLQTPDSPYVKHIDENSGWEGGFYSALFYSAGGAKATRPGNFNDAVVPEQALRLRELVGRAYLLDLAVLGSSDGVVCGISSASCRLLGVMMDWNAVKEGRWMNIDDRRPWSWDGQNIR